MSDTIEWLAANTEFDADTLEAFEDDHLATLKASVESASESHDTDCGCQDGTHDDAQHDDQTADADTEEAPESVQALSDELQSLRAEIEGVRSSLDEKRADAAHSAAERIADHAERFDDADAVIDALGDDPDTLGTLADEFEAAAAAGAPADFGGRVGANGNPGGRDDDAADYLALAKTANEARFGAPEDGDDR